MSRIHRVHLKRLDPEALRVRRALSELRTNMRAARKALQDIRDAAACAQRYSLQIGDRPGAAMARDMVRVIDQLQEPSSCWPLSNTPCDN